MDTKFGREVLELGTRGDLSTPRAWSLSFISLEVNLCLPALLNEMGFPLPSPSSLSSLALCLGFFFLMGQYYQLLPSISVYFLSSPLECTLYQGEEWLVHCDTLSIQNSTWYMTGPQQILTKQRKECFPSAAGFLFAEVRLSFQSESMHWTSLVVQWLRLCAPNAGDPG